MGDSQRIRIELIALLQRHQHVIRAYAYVITRDFTLTDDIAQEVALIVAERWAEMPHGEGELPWLKETTRRKALEALRKWKPSRLVLSPEAMACVEDAMVEDPRSSDPRRDALAACMAKLAGDARSIVESRYWGGRTCEEIAADLGRSVKSVYGILSRSGLALAACVERAAPDGAAR